MFGCTLISLNSTCKSKLISSTNQEMVNRWTQFISRLDHWLEWRLGFYIIWYRTKVRIFSIGKISWRANWSRQLKGIKIHINRRNACLPSILCFTTFFCSPSSDTVFFMGETSFSVELWVRFIISSKLQIFPNCWGYNRL